MTLSSDQDEQQFQPEGDISPDIGEAASDIQVPPDRFSPVQEVVINEPVVDIEDLTLAEAFRQVLRAPAYTLRSLRQIVSAANDEPIRTSEGFSAQRSVPAIWGSLGNNPAAANPLSDAERVARQREAFLLSMRLIAFMIAVYGNWIMSTERTEAVGLAGGLPFLLAAFCIWIAGDVFSGWPLRRQNQEHAVEEIDVLPDSPLNPLKWDFDFWPLTLRLTGAALALAMSLITLSATSGNRFTTVGVVMWVASTALWVIVFAPSDWGVRAFVASVRNTRLPRGWTLLALLGIMAVAVLFRFSN